MSPDRKPRPASLRAASTHCGSFIVMKAWSGVLLRARFVQTTSREVASKVSMLAGGEARFQKV